MYKNKRTHNLVYRYPTNAGTNGYPQNADEICRQLSSGLSMHRATSVLLIISLLGLLGYFVDSRIAVFFGFLSVAMLVVKIIVMRQMAVHLNYTMDQNWKNLANTRMAPFTYMIRCQRIWEVMSSRSGYDRKYNAGCNVQVSRKDVRVVGALPFPFKVNVNAYAIYLQDVRFVFLPDCVYMIRGTEFTALHYEHLKWRIGTTKFVESRAPSDARVVGYTWQYVNKKGGPDRRFNYNPQLVECLYGEFEVDFANQRRAQFLLSGTQMVEGMMRI